MGLPTLLRVLARRRRFHRRERWSRDTLLQYQATALAELRAHAVANSPFYRRFHAGKADRPLAELPVVTKAGVMDHFDEVVVDREVRLADVQAYLDAPDGGRLYLDRYQASATSGSTGRRGIFLADPDEWLTMITSYARANQWAGIATGLTHRVRMAIVSSKVPWHQSARVGRTVESRFVRTLRLDSTGPLPGIVAALNEFEPECLIGYASMIHVLAGEQLAGRLWIHPRAVNSASEVLSDDTRRRAQAAWGSTPFDVYAATETAGIASECEHHRLHLYEDLVIVEPVDEHHRAVPAGVVGASLLVTVLFSRTQPLIRYEMSDRVALGLGDCPCGRPFALLGGIDGRREDILSIEAAGGGSVTIHPNVFHAALERAPVAAWQVVLRDEALAILVERPDARFDRDELSSQISAALARQGAAALSVVVETVNAIPRGPLGKAPLVRSARRHEATRS
jgi:putative adenylate-forming enzyme